MCWRRNDNTRKLACIQKKILFSYKLILIVFIMQKVYFILFLIIDIWCYFFPFTIKKKIIPLYLDLMTIKMLLEIFIKELSLLWSQWIRFKMKSTLMSALMSFLLENGMTNYNCSRLFLSKRDTGEKNVEFARGDRNTTSFIKSLRLEM